MVDLWPELDAVRADRDFKVALNALNEALQPDRPARSLSVYMARQGTSYGLNLEANIVVAEKKQVLAIPKAALQKGDSVTIKEDGKEKRVKIQKGIEDENWVEVKSGLSKSATIILKK